MRSPLLLIVCVVLVQACGLKGPLYISTPLEQQQTAERARRLEERTQRERELQEQDRESTQRAPTAPATRDRSAEPGPPPPAPERTRPAEPGPVVPQPPPVQ